MANDFSLTDAIHALEQYKKKEKGPRDFSDFPPILQLWDLLGGYLHEKLNPKTRKAINYLSDAIDQHIDYYPALLWELISDEALNDLRKINRQNPTPICDKETTILIELAQAGDKTLSQIEISVSTNIPRGTVKDILPKLEKRKLVYRPLGKRLGYQITDNGKKVADRNQ